MHTASPPADLLDPLPDFLPLRNQIGANRFTRPTPNFKQLASFIGFLLGNIKPCISVRWCHGTLPKRTTVVLFTLVFCGRPFRFSEESEPLGEIQFSRDVFADSFGSTAFICHGPDASIGEADLTA